jgi:hypothetical protein
MPIRVIGRPGIAINRPAMDKWKADYYDQRFTRAVCVELQFISEDDEFHAHHDPERIATVTYGLYGYKDGEQMGSVTFALKFAKTIPREKWLTARDLVEFCNEEAA